MVLEQYNDTRVSKTTSNTRKELATICMATGENNDRVSKVFV